MSLGNQYDYYIAMYGWTKEIETNLRIRKAEAPNYHRTAYQWMSKNIAVSIFGTLLKPSNLDSFPEVIYNLCYEHLKAVLKVHHDEKLENLFTE